MGSRLFRAPPGSTPRGRRGPPSAPTLQHAALTAGALLATALAAPWAHATQAPRCQPAARLDGDQALVVPIGRLLRARGVAPLSQPGECRPVEVEITPEGSGYHLVIVDPEGRTSRRHLPSAESAALVIESWSRAELASSLPAGPAPPELDALPPTPSELPAFTSTAPVLVPAGEREQERDSPQLPEVRDLHVSEAQARPAGLELQAAAAPVASAAGTALARSLVSLSVAGESAFARNRAMWWGGSAGVCLRMGPLCTGLLARYGRASLLPASTLQGSAPLAHQEADLSLTAQLGLALGPVHIVPSLGLGAGRSLATFPGATLETSTPASGSTGRRDGDRRGRNDPVHRAGQRNPSSAMPPSPSTSVTTFDTAATTRREDHLLGHAGLILSVPIAGALAVDLGLSLGMALGRWGASGMPRERLRGGLGLRYGGP
jgi:hypothetical protein